MADWKEEIKTRDWWISKIVTVVIGLIIGRLITVSAFGMNRVWSGILYVVSLGSKTMRDAPYASAALNPYPTPAVLAMTICMTSLLTYMALDFIDKFFDLRRRARGLGDEDSKQRDKKSVDERRVAIRRASRMLKASSIVVGALGLGLLVQMADINEAVYIRQRFEANRDIVTPFISADQRLGLQAEFSAIETKNDYLTIMNKIKVVADEHHVKIHQF